ncbi:hypothetical protein [Sulfurisphaera javensis]
MPLIGEPHVGEIVAYKPPFLNIYIVHEIINVTPQGYITKGINNQEPDPWIVKRSWIKGFVPEIFGQPIVIPDLGYVISYIRGTNGYIYGIIFLSIIYVISEILDRNNIVMRNRKRRVEIPSSHIAMTFFVLSFFTFIIFFIPHAIYGTIVWNSVLGAPSVPVVLSPNLGAVPPNTYIPVIYNVHVSEHIIPLVVLYTRNPYLSPPNIYVLSNSTKVTFLLNTSSKGLHSITFGLAFIPEFLPPVVLEYLFQINSLLPFIVEGIEVSSVISLIVYLVTKFVENNII